MKISLPAAVTTKFARTSLLAQKNSPRILFASGMVLMGATVVTACKGTLSLEATLDDIKKDRDDIERVTEANPGKYSDSEIRKLHAYVTARGIAKVAKLYLPSITLGAAAVACLTSSHNQLTRRNAGLSAALAATERALDRYRERVRESLGEDKEMALWRGEKTITVDDVDEEGNPTGHKKKVKVGGGLSPYARVWGKDTTNEWVQHSEYNIAKLRSVQEWGTMMLNHRGHLFLNEIYDELGLSHTPAGAVCGWKSTKYGGKDGFVDFGVLDAERADRFLDFLTGHEDHIVLDFNVDGEIWRDI